MARCPNELKHEALRLSAQPDMSVAQVERHLGITPGLIYKWRKRYRVDEKTDALKPIAGRDRVPASGSRQNFFRRRLRHNRYSPRMPARML